MVVHVIGSENEFYSNISSPNLVVVDFAASWCGPCRMLEPKFEELSVRYEQVDFYRVMEDNLQGLVVGQGIRAFPTIRFYINGQQVDEVRGANIQKIEHTLLAHINSAQPKSFSGEGQSLGGNNQTTSSISKEEARRRRLERLGGNTTISSSSSNDSKITKNGLNQAITNALLSDGIPQEVIESSANITSTNNKPQPNTPFNAINQDLLAFLLEMGFTEIKAKKGLAYSNNTMEGAIQWIQDHQDDPDIDDPIDEMSIDNNDDMKIDDESNKSIDNNNDDDDNTSSENGNNDVQNNTPLSPDEKKKKVEELRERIRKKRQREAELEEERKRKRERDRREMGKKMLKTQEELEREQRVRNAKKIKREKEAARRERERLRAAIARDKEERKRNKGKLSSSLGIDGYNPNILQNNNNNNDSNEAEASKDNGDNNEGKREINLPKDEVIDKCIQRLMRYRVGGDGGKALKILFLYVKNILENPDDDKFRSINKENNAFKKKVLPLVGSVTLLNTLGFQSDDETNMFILSRDNLDTELLSETLEKLRKARAEYKR